MKRDPCRFEGSDAEDWLRTLRSEDHPSGGDFIQKLDLDDTVGEVHADTIGEHVRLGTDWNDANLCQL
jgi:hypothetical protein